MTAEFNDLTSSRSEIVVISPETGSRGRAAGQKSFAWSEKSVGDLWGIMGGVADEFCASFPVPRAGVH